MMKAVCAISQRPEQYVRKGDAAFDRGSYWQAYDYYQAAFSMDSTFSNTVKLANAARMVKHYELAAQCYGKAYASDQGNLFPEGLFWLAMMQKQLGDYGAAEKNFQKFVKRNKSGSDKTMIARADQEIKSCIWARGHQTMNDTLVVFTAPDPINSEGSELAPVFIGKRLAYVRQIETGSESQWDNRTYNWETKEPEWMKYAINRLGPFSVDSVGQRYFTTIDHDGKRSILVIPFDAAQRSVELTDLTSPQEVPSMPVVMRTDGRCFLLFACKGKQGMGGVDLWMSEEKNGNFGEKKNLGKNINTPGDELTPFFIQGKLFFSSDWHEGFGGYDVFVSRWQNGNWSKPVNLGMPLNTSSNDLYFTISAELEIACLASNRAGGETSKGFATCCNDLYFYRLPSRKPEKPTQPKEDTRDSLIAVIQSEFPIKLYFHNDEPNPRSRDTTTRLAYSECFQSYMALEDVYLRENAEGLTGEVLKSSTDAVRQFFDDEVKLGMQKLEGITDELLTLLQQNHSVHIQVRGFASPRAESDYNLNLTKRRTMSLLNYMRYARNGAFLPYLEENAKTKLTFELLPFGENKANNLVNDDLQNVKLSIYSVAACRERKIEVEAITIKDEGIPRAKNELVISDSVIDFGNWSAGRDKALQKIIYLNNATTSTIYLDSVVAECGCTEPQLSSNSIAPGNTAELRIGFNPFGPKGRMVQKKLTIYPRGMRPREIVLKVVME